MIGFTRKLAKCDFLARNFSNGLKTFEKQADNFMNGENAIYAEQMYQKWVNNRESVHASWDAYFVNLSNGVNSDNAFTNPPQPGVAPANHSRHSSTSGQTEKSTAGNSGNIMQEKLAAMIHRYRRRAHEISETDPLAIGTNKPEFTNIFESLETNSKYYGFSEADLNAPINYFSNLRGFHNSKSQWTPLEASSLLKKIYSGVISYEYMHIPSTEVHDWIRDRIEKYPAFQYTKAEKSNLLDRILESQTFTDFCDKKYSSSKRFGVEGLDSAISGLEKMVDTAKEFGLTNMVFGMAHRGRLNTLACVFDKPYETIFTEFKDPGIAKNIRSAEWGFSGDVKYHLGASNIRKYPDGKSIQLVTRLFT